MVNMRLEIINFHFLLGSRKNFSNLFIGFAQWGISLIAQQEKYESLLN